MNATQQLTYPTLVLWTRKFARPLTRLIGTTLQKIIASDQGALILHVHKPGDDRSLIILSIKKGESGISATHLKPLTQNKPNSLVQICRKYLTGRRIKYAYAHIAPISIVIEFADPPPSSPDYDLQLEGPNALILDLDAKPPRVALVKKYPSVPERYQKDMPNIQDYFFESWCEWSEEVTKTKRRALFSEAPLISYCPLVLPEKEQPEHSSVKEEFQTRTAPQKETEQRSHRTTPQSNELNINSALSLLPTHIRRAARTKLQFFSRRNARQLADFPAESEIARLEKQSEGLKTYLYLWPQQSLVWYVPPEIIKEYALPAVLTVQKNQKPGELISALHEELDTLTRRKKELTMRLEMGRKEEENFAQLIFKSSSDLTAEIEKIKEKTGEKKADIYVLGKNPPESLVTLCKALKIPLEETKKETQDKERLPYRTFFASSGEQIRVARSAADGDAMLKIMPSHHLWVHIFQGEGSHVWVAKSKSSVSEKTLHEAAILALHFSKSSKNQGGDVQLALRSDLEKRKHLPPGKVIVRRCETRYVKYDREELSRILTNE